MLNFEINGHPIRVAVHKHVTTIYTGEKGKLVKRAVFPTWNFTRMTRAGYYRKLNGKFSYVMLDMEVIKQVVANYAPSEEETR